MPHREPDPEQWLRRYVGERDAVAEQALRGQAQLTQSVLAAVRDARSQPSGAPADAGQWLASYVEHRDDVAAATPPLHRVDIRALVAEAAPGRTASERAVRLKWWRSIQQHWRVTAPIAAAMAVLLVVLVARHPGPSDSSPMRVVFAAASLRGGDPAAGTNGVLPLPCTLELDLQRLAVKLLVRDGAVYAGSLAAGELLQTSPWKKRFTITALGKNAASEAVELRGTLTLTLERPPDAPAAQVLGAILELQPNVAGRTLKNVRLEFPE